VTVFLDTSALYAVLDRGDDQHQAAAGGWLALLDEGRPLLTSNYVIVETAAVVQHRLGIEAVRAFHDDVLPLVSVHWVGEDEHAAAMAALLTAGRRRLSLVDCTSFEVMRRRGIRRAFAVDPHFAEQGFTTLP
jgi:predicted nucleic acid-binding protein